MTKIQQIKQFAKNHLDDVRWIHTQQVVKTALEITKKEGADLEVVEISAWMHDTGTTHPKSTLITHHLYSVEITKKLLSKFQFSEEKIDRILNCIKQHMGPIGRFDDQLKIAGITKDILPVPDTIEAKVLYDADMINLLGPFGLVKIIYLKGKRNENFTEGIKLVIQLSKEAYRSLFTKTGKQIGKKYYQTSSKMFKLLNL